MFQFIFTNNVNFKGIGCICDPGFDGEFCEVTTTVAPATTESNTDDYDYDYSSTTLATTETEATENAEPTEESTEGTTEDSKVDSTEENTDGNDSGEIPECENPNPEVITIGNGTILQAYCDEGSLNGTR